MSVLRYTKGDPTEEPFAKHVRGEAKRHAVPLQIKGAVEGYSKGDGTVSPGLFLVISGGTTRERNFLGEFLKEGGNSFTSLKIIFLSSAQRVGGLTPKMMEEEFQSLKDNDKIAYKNVEIHLSDIDEVFMISDVDHYESQLRELLSSSDGSCHWIISNPDFEVWLYYCYFSNPAIDLQAIVDSPASKRSRLMKKLNDSLHPGGIDPRKAFARMEQGIHNAENNYREDENGFPLLLSTQMFRFCQCVYHHIHDEFDAWLQEQRRRIQQFMR